MSTVESTPPPAAQSTPPPAAQSTPSKTIVLRSSDGECFEVEESVALECGTIKQMIEDGCADSAIPLPNISSKILSKIIEYCNRHAHSDAAATIEPPDGVSAGDDLKKFDAEFLNVDQSTLFDLILGANFLEAKKLLDLTCQYVADMMKGKKPDEIRKMFNIENDFTPEEEEAIRKENPWAYE